MAKVKVMKDSDHIEAVIKRTFETLQNVYDSQQEIFNGPKLVDAGSRLLFPRKRKEITRISEQELRFVFVEQLNKEIQTGWDVYYSVETPTVGGYVDFSTESPKRDDKKGRSGCIDMVIHDSTGKRICMIEFKANNPKPSDYAKDFCKLNNEGIDYGYFLQIVENYESDTKSNIENKIESYKVQLESSKKNVFHYCYCLKKKDYLIEKVKV